MMLFSNPRFDAQGGAVNEKFASRFRMRAAALAVASCMSMTPWLAEAAGLGKITVLSSLGQPLRAEVEIGANREELAGMTAHLAAADAFKQAGVDYVSILSDLRFSLDKRPNGASVVRITSSKPVNEPFLDFLVELNWPTGRLVREYTFLLDPPEVAAKSASKAVSVAEAKPVSALKGGVEAESALAVKSVPKETAVARSEPKAQPKPKATEGDAKQPEDKKSDDKKPESTGSTHLVKQGETLGKIAGEARYEGVSLEQMLVGLYRANADAFVGSNINRLKAGAILNLPDKETIAAIPQAEARKTYLAQAADWNAYRRKLAAAAAQGPAKEDAGGQSAGGKITAKVEEKAAPAEAQKDQVKVSRTESATQLAAVGAAKAEENRIAKEKALKESQERVALLEKNVSDLQKLVEMKNQNLAEMQKQAAAKKPEEQKAPEPAKAAEVPKPVEAAKPAEPEKPAEPPKAEEALKPADTPKAAEAEKSAEPPKPPVAKKRVVLPEPEPEPDFMDELMENPLPLAGAGGILALLAGFFVYKRRRQSTETLSMASPSTVELGPNSVFRATGGQSVDTGNTTPQTTDFSQTGPGTIDTDEVDPVAEADVYMAYGRDAQAEEILLEALQKDPHRSAIHVKLLEIYAGRKSLKQFETLASELYAQTGGAGHDWEKVVAMGVRLDPGNPLYAGSKSGAVTSSKSLDADTAQVVSSLDAPEAGQALSTPVVQPDELPLPAETSPPLDLGLASWTPDAAPAEEPLAEPAKAAETELMSLDFDLGTAAPAAAPVEAAPVAEVAAPEVGTLDFDLGLVSPVKTPEVVETAVATEADPLDFDLNIGLPSVAPVAEVASPEPALSVAAMPESMIEEVITLASEPVVAEAPELASTETMLDFDFDIGSPAVSNGGGLASSGATTAVAAAPVEEVVDIDGLNLDIQMSEAKPLDETVEAPAFDMSAINLDLVTDTPVQAPELAAAAPEPMFEIDAAKDPHWEEVNTKLDLAKAYEEMGDLEGARELLQEILGEGSSDLVDQAKGMLERIEA